MLHMRVVSASRIDRKKYLLISTYGRCGRYGRSWGGLIVSAGLLRLWWPLTHQGTSKPLSTSLQPKNGYSRPGRSLTARCEPQNRFYTHRVQADRTLLADRGRTSCYPRPRI